MIEHGIHTTTADYWVHFIPPDFTLYYYQVRHCRDYIKQYNLPLVGGSSKDLNKTVTGRGYLIPKTADFLMGHRFRKSYVADVDYLAMTDREFGMWGQRLVDVLISKAEVWFPPFQITKLTSKADQFSGADLLLNREVRQLRIEVKSERKQTANIFVQSAELNHRVHETGTGEYRPSELF